METREILQDIIDGFSPDKFTRFFREKNRSFAPRQESFIHYNDEYFSDGIKLGEIKFSESENLLVCAFQASHPLTERSGKKAQYEKGKKILREMQYDAGIFIFYDRQGNFRFSLIYANYLGRHRDWSVFRRFTYFVNKEYTNKTFLQRIGDGDFSSLEKIKDAFSVEKVTKEFYEDIANWYLWAVQQSAFPKDAEVEENGRNIAVIRLITRIIFIWFMREKSLVPKKLFEEKSISAMLEEISPESSTYYQAILQNLFFATLSAKKNERKFRSEIRGYKGYNPDFGNQNVFRFQELFKNPEKLKDYFGEIPFLNGGLFECLDDKPNGIYIDGFTAVKKNQSNVPNILFFSGERKADLNAVYGTKDKNYKVRGLLDILSSYNFTIDENSPDDQEIALDPELLGRVFENLLASFNPETSTTARKATGSYYTPREIVDYMVAESLKAYFKTHLSGIGDLDKKIDSLFSTVSEENPFDKLESKKLVELIESVRIVDPAVGSGAFPMGALNKLVFILNKVDPGNELWKQAQLSVVDTIPDPRIKQDTKNRIEEFFKGKNADYGRKLYLIQKCIYGVDIQQIAVEIAKLRFFISLLVDEKIDRDHPDGNWGIEPLPNLDFKIMQGNSLISKFLGIDFDNGQEKQDAQGQIGLRLENEDDNLIKEFERKKIDYQNESDKDKKAKLKNEAEDLMIKIFEAKLQKKYSELKPIEERAQSIPDLKTREEYIKTEKEKFSKKHGFDLGNIEKQLREFTSKNKARPFFPWKLYFAEVFENGGFDIVIANPPYINIEKLSEETKKYIFETYNCCVGRTDIYIAFLTRALNLLRDSGILSFIVPYAFTNQKYGEPLRTILVRNHYVNEIVDTSEYFVFESANVKNIVLQIGKLKSTKPTSIKIARTASAFETRTFEEHSINQSEFLSMKDCRLETKDIHALLGVKTKVMHVTVKFEDICFIGYGARLNHKAKDIGKEHYISETQKTGYKPYVEGKDIERYFCTRSSWLNYVPEEHYNPMFEELFENDKLMFINVVKDTLRFAYNTDSYYNSHTVINCVKWNLLKDVEHVSVRRNISPVRIKNAETCDYKFLLAILNSSLLTWYFNNFLSEKLHFYPEDAKNLPIKVVPRNEQGKFIAIADKILKSKAKNPGTDTTDLEKQIDQMVYKLYGLTPEEINIVESNRK